MTILCYAPSGNLDAEHLFAEIETVLPAHDTQRCHSREELVSLDLRLAHQDTLLVLFIVDREALDEMLSIKGVLRQHKIILILPDSEPKTVSKGHSLYPRFVAYLDGDLGHVALVLAKMAAQRQQRAGPASGCSASVDSGSLSREAEHGAPQSLNYTDFNRRRLLMKTTESPQPQPRSVCQSGLYLTFGLGREGYGLPVNCVQEIIGIAEVTAVPRTPPYVRGVINLRGKVIPVIDLAACLGMAAQEDTERTCIIVVEISSVAEAKTVGLIVDGVREVLEIDEGQVEPLPSLGNCFDTGSIAGMAKVGEEVLSLLELEALLAGREQSFLVGSEA